MGVRSTTVEEICSALARRSHGIVARAELFAAGLTRREIESRRERGYLIVEFPGVYRVGHRAPRVKARYMAAVKACGEGATLSGPAAAWLYGLITGPAPPPHVTAPRKRRVEGVVTCRSQHVETVSHRGIPITTVARTLVDLAGPLSLTALGRACHEAGVKYRTTPGQVEEVLARRPNAPGAGKLREVIAGRVRVTQSALERRFLALLAANDLPPPDEVNKPAGTFRVDARWHDPPLTVELDSYRHEDPRAMLRELRSVLTSRGASDTK